MLQTGIARNMTTPKRNISDSDSLSFTPVGSLSGRPKFILTIIFLIVIIVESSFLYWQFGVIMKNKSARDVSSVSYAILIGTNLIWLMFGIFVLGSVPIIVSGALYTIGASLVLGGRLVYGDGKEEETTEA